MSKREQSPWLKDQAAPTPASRINKVRIIRQLAADQLKECGTVSYSEIGDALVSLGRGYATKTDVISAALAMYRRPNRRGLKLDPYPNGFRVMIEGRVYRSIREAARVHECAVETVRKRIASERFPEWRLVEPA